MEFKDRLKKLRQEKHLSQQELADAIYVSRSAIAKWENGLGIPNKTSYKSLLDYFKVTSEEFPLNEETESFSVSKNKKIRHLFTTVITLSLVIISILSFVVINAFMNGYGFTSKMAVGKTWANAEYIQTPEYDFYYGVIGGDSKIIDRFCVAEKKLIGYQTELNLEEHKKTVYDENGGVFGYIYSFKGKYSYYHLYISIKTIQAGEIGVKINLLNEITIKEDTISVLYNSYFETDFKLKEFYSNGNLYTVK